MHVALYNLILLCIINNTGVIKMFESIYKTKGKNINIKKSATFSKFPISIPDEMIKGILKLSNREYSSKFVKNVVVLYFSLMAQKLKETSLNTSFDMKSLGYLTMEIKPKVCKLTFPPTVKIDAKRMKFRFKLVFKRLCWKKFNQDKIDEVVEYIQKKKRSRSAIIRYNKLRLSGEHNI